MSGVSGRKGSTDIVKLVIWEGRDAFLNLAVEEALFRAGLKDDICFMLWRDDPVVVIGRNQNAWAECRVDLLESEGGKLARRITGGGAVYHDEGNLNFTFVSQQNAFNASRNAGVVTSALQGLGIKARCGGRNDILLPDGRKCSGQAYAHSNGRVLHHGTLLLDVDKQNVARYLTPRQHKHLSKGVPSVEARVGNLSEFVPSLDGDQLTEALTRAFFAEYGGGEAVRALDLLDVGEVEQLRERNASDVWRLGESPRMNVNIDAQLSFGHMRLCFLVEQGRVADCLIESDALDASAVRALAGALVGCEYGADKLSALAAQSGTSFGLGYDADEVAALLADAVKS